MHDHMYEGDDSTSRIEKNEMWSTSNATHQRSFDHFVQCSTGNVLLDAVSQGVGYCVCLATHSGFCPFGVGAYR